MRKSKKLGANSSGIKNGTSKRCTKAVKSQDKIIGTSKACEEETFENNLDEEKIMDNFALELRWCIQQMEIELNLIPKDKRNTKKVEEMTKCYKILCSPKQPMIKKRQLMNVHFGDYRSKMAEGAKKFKFGTPTVKQGAKPPPSSVYIRKAQCVAPPPLRHSPNNEDLGMGELSLKSKTEDSFKFNFSVVD